MDGLHGVMSMKCNEMHLLVDGSFGEGVLRAQATSTKTTRVADVRTSSMTGGKFVSSSYKYCSIHPM